MRLAVALPLLGLFVAGCAQHREDSADHLDHAVETWMAAERVGPDVALFALRCSGGGAALQVTLADDGLFLSQIVSKGGWSLAHLVPQRLERARWRI